MNTPKPAFCHTGVNRRIHNVIVTLATKLKSVNPIWQAAKTVMAICHPFQCLRKEMGEGRGGEKEGGRRRVGWGGGGGVGWWWLPDNRSRKLRTLRWPFVTLSMLGAAGL